MGDGGIQRVSRREQLRRDAQRAAAQPTGAKDESAGLLGWQGKVGNRTLLAVLGAQAKLEVGRVDDPAEREADSAADRAVSILQASVLRRSPGDDPGATATMPLVRRIAGATGPVGPEGGTLDPGLEKDVAAARSGGAPLPPARRSAMESAFGADFGAVRIHQGPTAERLSRQLGAKAFTLGKDVFFRDGLPGPSQEGQHLLAHELAHTVQQGGSHVGRQAETVQRLTDDEKEEGRGKLGDASDYVSGQVSTFASFGGADHGVYLQGNVNTAGAGAGDGGSLFADVAGGVGLYNNIGNLRSSDETMKSEKAKGREGGAKYREAKRTNNSSGANIAQNVGSVASNSLSGIAGVSQIMSNAGSTTVFAGANNAIGSAGGALALPFQILATIRNIRKAAKQWGRVAALRKNVDDPNASVDAAAKAKQDQIDSVTAMEETRTALRDERAEVKKMIKDLPSSSKHRRANYESELERIQEAIDAMTTKIREGRDETKRLQAAEDAARQAIVDAAERVKDGKESPDDIRVYAFKKNQSGFAKKVIGVVGGVLGIGGGVAATVASIAAISTVGALGITAAATPVGWALCGAAAVIALGMGGYAFWKWASKKYDRARQEGMSKGAAFLAAINPFKKVGQSRRERNAERLYEYACGNDPDQPGQLCSAKDKDEAVTVITELGLDYSALKMGRSRNKEASIKLIYAKLAS